MCYCCVRDLCWCKERVCFHFLSSSVALKQNRTISVFLLINVYDFKPKFSNIIKTISDHDKFDSVNVEDGKVDVLVKANDNHRWSRRTWSCSPRRPACPRPCLDRSPPSTRASCRIRRRSWSGRRLCCSCWPCVCCFCWPA